MFSITSGRYFLYREATEMHKTLNTFLINEMSNNEEIPFCFTCEKILWYLPIFKTSTDFVKNSDFLCASTKVFYNS